MTISHEWIAVLVKWEILTFLAGIFGVISLRFITGQINTRHLLWTKGEGQIQHFSSERVQLLVSTIGVAMEYLLTAAKARTGEMPQLPDVSLEVLGLSNLIYLGCKSWKVIRNRMS